VVEGFFAKKSRSITEALPVEHSKIRTRLKAQLTYFCFDAGCFACWNVPPGNAFGR
jgi:hypothetical protein